MQHFYRRTAASVCAAAATLVLVGTAHAGKTSFFAVLNAGQEVPPTNSAGTGNAYMTFDSETSQLCYSISYIDLSNTEVAAHFHAPGVPGEDAPAIADISPMP